MGYWAEYNILGKARVDSWTKESVISFLLLIFLRGSYLLYKLLKEEPRVLDALPILMVTLYIALLLFYSVFHGRAKILDDKEHDFYTSKIYLPAIKRETLIPLPRKQNKTTTNNKKNPSTFPFSYKTLSF